MNKLFLLFLLDNIISLSTYNLIILSFLLIAVLFLIFYLFRVLKKYNNLKYDYNELKSVFSEDIILSKFSIDNSNDFIIWTNKYGEILYYNNSFIKKLDYSSDLSDFTIKNIFNSSHFDDWKKYWEHIKNNKIIVFETTITGTGNTLIPVEVSSVYFVCKGTEYNIFIAHDISNHKNKNDLKTISKTKLNKNFQNNFLAHISHEIRTPMNAIVGFSDLIIDSDLTDKQKQEIIYQIKLNSELLLNFIDDIIDLSLLESNNLELNKQFHRLNDLLLNIYFYFKENKNLFALDNEIGFSLRIDEKINDFEINIDSIRFRQVFSNLIKNAFKLTFSGYVEFGYKINANNSFTFFVKDNGNPLPSKIQQLLTDKNHIISEDGDYSFAMMLRLMVAKSLIELMDGKLWTEFEPENGNTFYFTLPIENIHLFANKLNKPESINWHNKTILIVDDLDYNYEIIEEQLRHTNAKILWAKNGKEAVEIFQKNKQIDLILMDIRMPVMDGYEATREIKKIDKKVPIIAQTAYALSEEKEKSLRAGCNDYITKPLNRKLLVEIIEKYIDIN